MKQKKPKEKQCKICANRYMPRATTQVVCSPRCALKLEDLKRRKAYDAETRRRRKAIKSKADYASDAQKSFNSYVRARDHALPCISCNKFHTGRYDAGHFLSVGAFPELRYHLWNVHKQCHWNCNINRSGNQALYRQRLVEKLGNERVEWLEGPHDAKKYTIDDLIRIKKIFNKKLKRLNR